MGFALASAALGRGAKVTCVAGITSVAPPAGVNIINVGSAEEMHRAVARESNTATVFIAAAAVSDYRTKLTSQSKLKKSEAELELKLERTPDILRSVAQSRRNGQLILGFAAETDDLLANAREKLITKNLDAIVANDISREDSGFDTENNAIVILVRNQPNPIQLPLMSKLEAAHRILDEVVKLRRANVTARTASEESR